MESECGVVDARHVRRRLFWQTWLCSRGAPALLHLRRNLMVEERVLAMPPGFPQRDRRGMGVPI